MKKQNLELEYIPLDDNENYYYTTDLGCASAIIVAGIKLESLDKEIKPYVFIFKRDEENKVEKIAKSYFDYEFGIDAQTYFNSIKNLKNRIHSTN